MAYEILYARSAVKELGKLPKKVVQKIQEAIKALADDPHPPGSKKLEGEENTYRIRVRDYRVLYEIDDKEITILVIRIRHRKDAYK